MTNGFVNATTAHQTPGLPDGQTLVLAVPAGVANGDGLIAGLVVQQTAPVPPPPAGWSNTGTGFSLPASYRLDIYTHTAASEPASYTWDDGIGNNAISLGIMGAYRGTTFAGGGAVPTRSATAPLIGDGPSSVSDILGANPITDTTVIYFCAIIGTGNISGDGTFPAWTLDPAQSTIRAQETNGYPLGFVVTTVDLLLTDDYVASAVGEPAYTDSATLTPPTSGGKTLAVGQSFQILGGGPILPGGFGFMRTARGFAST